MIRRAIDMLAAGAGLILTAPLAAGLLLVQWRTIGRPLFFVQRRGAQGGGVFRLWKLRTMSDARDAGGRLLPDAQRVTRWGLLLRRVRLDEWPQLWHILIGEMSLIGPRPLLPETIAAGGAAGRVRARVRPGLTGWAQVSGNTLLTDAEKLELDAWYVRNRSWRLDLRIVMRTVQVVLRGERRDPAAIGRAYARDHHRGG
jgi:lipopolysaccharide/colanic/teichoic acid biosynthesis glycosyltransferase